MKLFFQDLNQYKGYIITSIKAQLKAELANSWLGCLWWILEPTLSMLLYMFVFTIIFHRTTTYIVAFILVGITYWRFFNHTVMSSITLVKRYRGVLSKIYLPKYILVISLMGVNGFKLLCSYGPIIALMIYYQVPLSIHMFTTIILTILLLLFTFGVSCWCMHIGVYVEDLHRLMQFVLQAVFYASGVFYPIVDTLSPSFSSVLLSFNPMALILYEVRNALLYATPCHWGLIFIYFGVSIILGITGVFIIYRKGNQYIKIV